MSKIALELTKKAQRAIWEHLLPSEHENEEAAFAFVQPGTAPNSFSLLDWCLVPPDGFAYQSPFHLELADAYRAKVIKRAHDLNASLVEFHSHLSPGPPAFSSSDIYGFQETVPHFMWRLKARPYFAVVVSQSGFDALCWLSDPKVGLQLHWILNGQTTLVASCRTLESYRYE